MCNPSAQDYFATERSDDLGLPDDARLIRHCRTPVQIVPDGGGGFRVSSQAFLPKPREPGTSVDVECLLQKDGHPPDHRYGLMPNTLAMLAITAGQARAVANGACWTPKPKEPGLVGAAAEENPWHGEVLGVTAKASRALASSALVVRSDL